MSRVLTVINLLGILALAGLCAVQWRTNRLVNLEAIGLERIRLEQVARIADQDRSIRGLAADLEEFRGRLTIAEEQQKETQKRLLAMTDQKEKLARERDGLIAEREKLKIAIDKWSVAVAERNKALKDAGDEIQQVAKERNDAAVKFNELVEKYNTLVKDLDEAHRGSPRDTDLSTRIRDF